MIEKEPGWYRDPAPANQQSPTTKRYWDGQQWTTQVRAASRQERTAWQHEIAQEQREHFALAMSAPAQPGVGLATALRSPGVVSRDYTPDGYLLAGWWSRAGALAIDWLLTTILGVVLGWRYVTGLARGFSDYSTQVSQAMAAGTQPPTADALGSQLLPSLIGLSVVMWGVKLVYTVGFLKAFQATPGKFMLGLEVRLRERPGTLSWGTVLVRWLIQNIGALVGLVPVVGLLGSFYPLLNYLWPLWDGKRQALHDKVAGTNVVRRGG